MEAIQKISDEPLKDCPGCEQETLRKLVSAAAFKLTGTGWYETDFKDKKPNKKDAQEKYNKGKEDGQSSKDKGSDKTDASDKSGKKSESKMDSIKKKALTKKGSA